MAIWLVGLERADMIANQRMINKDGSMQAICLLTPAHLKRAIAGAMEGTLYAPLPSLILFDHDCLEEDDGILSEIKENRVLAGTPLFFAVRERSEALDEECYAKGAMVVVHKRLSSAEFLRVQNTAWRFDNTRLYEQALQRQAAELISAKEIFNLNTQLKARNSLLRKVFGRYFSDDVVDEILKDGDAVSLGGEKRRATILLSDLRGFTAMAEVMDPEELSTLLNYYFGRMVDVVESCHGTVIEFMGDGLLAVFGALLHHSTDQAKDALAAAIGMQNAMEEVNTFCGENGFPMLEMGIGVHTGEVFVGNIGSERLMRYNVVGNAVNVCARIESCTVGGQVVTSKDTLALASIPVEYRPMGMITVKGASRAIAVFEVQGLGGDEPLTLSEAAEREVWSEPVEPVEIGLYPVNEKRITASRVDAKVVAVSQYHLKASPLDGESSFALYETVALATEKNAGGFGWYAKVTERKGGVITLRFTQKDEGAERFIDQCST